ncbi:hypothetical protein E9993_11150 [Labilibacter sediminis]|nr:hypothetical protein E9993_11150 [Labilibacter sediminis]
MNKENIFLGNANLNFSGADVEGEFVEIANEKFYKISHYNQMADFFMSIVSDSDHWMFLSSNGSLSAGRKNRNNALFPYYTVDKIHDYKGETGSKTIALVSKDGKTYLWEPFADCLNEVYKIERNIYKSIYGNKVIFEEINTDLEVAFKYSWSYSEKFGIIKTSTISNVGQQAAKLEIIDGIKNILPYGIDYDFQNEYSNLLDAYKKNELLKESGLGLFMLSSIPVDRAEPSESLKTTTVWSLGLQGHKILLSDQQIANFKKGVEVETEVDVRANRGAYYLNTVLELDANASKEWMIVSEINQDSVDVANLNQYLLTETNIKDAVIADVEQGTRNLIKIVSDADGLQVSNDDLSYARHFSNTLFNVMRGGIFTNNYMVDTNDFKLYVEQTNKTIKKEFNDWLNQLPQEISYPELNQLADKTGNADLIRISNEYLPLTFSRRHGDPSRPWNQFSIETKNEDGSPKLNYQGNWRDIFQNWEALGLSYPEFVEGMISKFVNASTPDGYNPYRITREGIDWECPDPDDPWAYIGYWGDHQIIYLQKFLELSRQYHPGKLESLLTKDVFVYANVPYRVKSYEQIVANPQDTIEFDADLNKSIKEKVELIGADARMLANSNNELYKVNLTEKILVTLLSKLSNFIPEAGIWLNTQRPEWNDANNALVGNGVSMVTLYYLRRFLKFWSEQFEDTLKEEIELSEEVKHLFDSIFNLFATNVTTLEKGFSDEERRMFADTLGEAGETYRNKIYNNSFSGVKKAVKVSDLLAFTNVALAYMDQSIDANIREDGLYHAYNLISFGENTVSIRYLYEMLEGQVAVLSSGYLSPKESLDVLDSLKASSLFREDQYSYILYPDRQLPRFTEKNNIPANRIKESKLLSKLITTPKQSILSADTLGNFHFNGAFRNADMLQQALDALDADTYGDVLVEGKQEALNVFEEMFDHQSFTGRSGTFYGYEGLGSIYWHMVSKLLLAAQENYFNGVKEGADAVLLGRIKDHYYEIKAGIGLGKSPKLYGAFPTDAYSHTPGNAGAKQPGMTGQVKEDFITRMAELGIHVVNGEIVFGTSLLNHQEVLQSNALFEYYDIEGCKQQVNLNQGQLAFTFCKVPVIYQSSDKNKISIYYKGGDVKEFDSNAIDAESSAHVFSRSGLVQKMEVSIKNK